VTEFIFFRKQYDFPNAHFIQFDGQLSVCDGDTTIAFLQVRDGRRLVPSQTCLASTVISKPRELIEYAVRSLAASMAGQSSAQPTSISEFPQAIARAVRDVERRLNQHATSLAKSFRWRCNAHGTAQVLKTELAPFFWSLDGTTWFPVYSSSVFEPIEWQFEILDHVIEPEEGPYQAPDPEPLAFELLMEARQLQYDNPRSALVVAVAAAEVGTKRCLQFVDPGIAAVLESVDCPPMLDLLDRYYPENSTGQIVPSIVEELRKAISERNRLVHTGKFTLSREQVRRRLSAIEDLLRLFDMQMGNEWAANFLTGKVRKQLGLPLLSLP